MGCCDNRRERANRVTMKGSPLTLLGPELAAGDAAPAFVLVRNDLSEARLGDFAGKTVLISAVPSLDTPVCDKQTRRFNQEAAALRDTVILTVSMDLPFAQKRWCGAAGIEKAITLSDHRTAEFGASYGVLIKDLRLLARAIFVIGKDGCFRHVEIVPEITQEPDYEAALAALR